MKISDSLVDPATVDKQKLAHARAWPLLDKLQVDMLELVRKALIINPKDIDSEAYMKITTAVDFNNLMELRPLLTKLVQNHYPDLEMDEVTPGPGV